MAAPPRTGRLWAQRIGWLILLWAGSVIGLGIIAMALRLIMQFAGLTG